MCLNQKVCVAEPRATCLSFARLPGLKSLIPLSPPAKFSQLPPAKAELSFLFFAFLFLQTHLFIKWEKLSAHLLFFGRSLSPSVFQKCLSTTFHPLYSSSRHLTPFSIPSRPPYALIDLLSINFFYLSLSTSDGFSKSKPSSRMILATADFSKVF